MNPCDIVLYHRIKNGSPAIDINKKNLSSEIHYISNDEKEIKMELSLDELREFLNDYNVNEKFPKQKRNGRYYWLLKYLFSHIFPTLDRMRLNVRDDEIDILNEKIIKVEKDAVNKKLITKLDVLPNINLKNIEKIYEIELFDHKTFHFIYSLIINDEEYYIGIDIDKRDSEPVYTFHVGGELSVSKDLSFLTKEFNDRNKWRRMTNSGEYFRPYINLRLKNNENYLFEKQSSYSLHDDYNKRKKWATELICFWFSQLYKEKLVESLIYHDETLYYTNELLNLCISENGTGSIEKPKIQFILDCFSTLSPDKINEINSIEFSSETNFSILGNCYVTDPIKRTKTLTFFNIQTQKIKGPEDKHCTTICSVYISTDRCNFYNSYLINACRVCIKNDDNDTAWHDINATFGMRDGEEERNFYIISTKEKANNGYDNDKSKYKIARRKIEKLDERNNLFSKSECNFQESDRFCDRMIKFIEEKKLNSLPFNVLSF